MKFWPRLLAGALVISVPAPFVAAMQTTTIGSTPNCEECEIRLERAIVLTDDPDVAIPLAGGTKSVVQDSEGRFIVAHDYNPSQLVVFDQSGKFLRTLGRDGEGPGEFARIMKIGLSPEGDIHAFDYSQLRETLYSEDLELMDTRLLPFRVRDVEWFGDGRVVVAARSFSPAVVGFPLHTLGVERNVELSFGAVDETVRPDMTALQRRFITRASDDSVWAAYVHKYTIEEWSISGERRRVIARSADWFLPWFSENGFSPAQPPQPEVQEVFQDPDGLLWVICILSDPNWPAGLTSGSAEGGGYGVSDWERLFDSYVEVIDTSTMELVASRRYDEYFLGFTNRGHIIGYREDAEGTPSIDLWTASIAGRE